MEILCFFARSAGIRPFFASHKSTQAFVAKKYSTRRQTETDMETQMLCRFGEQTVRSQPVRELLEREGYPVDGGLERMLDALSRRLEGREFPHEVGLFLGYPPEDVEGFRLHRGRGCKLCGCWKVYSDVERARRCFRRYGLCRAALCRRLEEVGSLIQMFRAA